MSSSSATPRPDASASTPLRPEAAARARRDQSRAETRRAILDATEALLLEVGAEGFSVRKLVDRCGYSAPTIYHHFNDKQGLIDALLEQRLALLVQEIESVPSSDDPVENLSGMVSAFATWGLNNPTHYQLLTQVPEDDVRIIETAERARVLMETPIDQIERNGWLAIDDAEDFRQAIWVTAHGIISMRVLRPDVEWSDTLLDRCIEGLMRGWLVPAEERK